MHDIHDFLSLWFGVSNIIELTPSFRPHTYLIKSLDATARQIMPYIMHIEESIILLVSLFMTP